MLAGFRSARRTARVLGASAAITALYSAVRLARGSHHCSDPLVAARWARRWAAALARGFDLHVHTWGRSPREASLIVANHRSYLDIVALGGLVDACFVAKAEIARWPLLGPTFRLSPTIFVHRGSRPSGHRARAQVLERLGQGVSVINFPEGTTHGGTGLLPFKPGLFHAVLGAQIPVVPATVTYSIIGPRVEWIGDDTFWDHLLRLAAHRGASARVWFGEPVLAADFATAKDLLVEVRRQMLLDLAPRETPAPSSGRCRPERDATDREHSNFSP